MKEQIEIKCAFTGVIEKRSLYGVGRKRGHCYDVVLGQIETTVNTKQEISQAVSLRALALIKAPAPMIRLQKDGRILVATVTGCNDDGVLSLSLARYMSSGRTSGSSHFDLRTGTPGDWNGVRTPMTVHASADEIESQVKRELEYELARIDECTHDSERDKYR